MTARTLEQLWHAHETRESLALALQQHHDEGIPQAEDLRDTAAQWSRRRNDILAEMAILSDARLVRTDFEVKLDPGMPVGEFALVAEPAAPVLDTTETDRLRRALKLIANHELRDHEDYDAIREIAEEALRT